MGWCDGLHWGSCRDEFCSRLTLAAECTALYVAGLLLREGHDAVVFPVLGGGLQFECGSPGVPFDDRDCVREIRILPNGDIELVEGENCP